MVQLLEKKKSIISFSSFKETLEYVYNGYLRITLFYMYPVNPVLAVISYI